MTNLLKLAIEMARASGQIQKNHLGKVRHIRFKGEINLVTEVDKKCEELIIKKIRRSFPDHDILTEESGILQKKKARSEFRWIIDPLDGTTNYAHRYPLFCTSIGLERSGQVILGAVFDPIRGELFTVMKDRGAFLNGKKIRVSKTIRLKRAMVATGFAYDVQRVTQNNLNHFENFIRTSQAVRRDGVAAIDLCYVACGRFDGFWELKLWPWDIAAASLIVKEAGGTVTMFDGSPLDIYGREIVASNGKIHAKMRQVLNG